jgi:hypothetical protein
VSVETRDVGYFLDSAEEWWDIVWNAGFRRYVTQLPENGKKWFKKEHLQEIENLRTKDGIRLDIGVLYTIGTKPVPNVI